MTVNRAAFWRSAFCLVAGIAVGLCLGILSTQYRSPPHQQRLRLQVDTAGDVLCNVLRPQIDAEALRLSTILPKSLSSRRGAGCHEGVWYEMGRQGLGHRLGNYMAGLALSLAWGLPPLIGSDNADRCGPHGCYPGAEDVLGLARGLSRVSQFAPFSHTRVKQWQHGTSLKAALGRLDNKGCTTLWTLGQDVWLRDLSIARQGLRAQMLARSRTKTLPPLAFNTTSNGTVIVAIHLRYGGSDSHKRTDETWLRRLLLEELVPLSASASVPVEWHVFTGSAQFSWLARIKGVVVHGKEVDAVTAFRSMTNADVLVCGHSSLCFHAALVLASQPLALALLPANTEPFPYDMCPDDLVCVAGTGALTPEQRIRFVDVVSRSSLSRSYQCSKLSNNGK